MNKYIKTSFFKEMMIDEGAGGVAAATDGISFDKSQLSSALEEFDQIKIDSLVIIENINTYLKSIDSNWSGEQHDNAKTDKDTAEMCLDSASKMLNSVSGSVGMLSSNANKVNYNS